MNEYWFVIYVKPTQETSFQRWSEERGCVAYFPRSSYMTKPHRKKKALKFYRPAFPGYVFIRYFPRIAQDLDIENSMVISILRHAGHYCVIHDSEIEDIKQREVRGEFDEELIKTNDTRVFKNGPFNGSSAVVKRIDKRGRHNVVLEMGSKTIKMSLANLENNSYKLALDVSSDLAAP